MNQPIRNKTPIRNATPEICRDQNNIYHSNGFLISRIIYNSPARIKAIPPTISYFQEINRIINKISAGILCMKNPNIVCQKLNPVPKTSSDIKAKKQINIMDKILGVQ